MEAVVLAPPSQDRAAVALKAWSRIVGAWGLTLAEAAALADMSESTWKRARKPGFAGDLTQDQMLRLSALVGIYKALTLYFGEEVAPRWIDDCRTGGRCSTAPGLLDTMIADGLPQFLRIRDYLDALRGGA